MKRLFWVIAHNLLGNDTSIGPERKEFYSRVYPQPEELLVFNNGPSADKLNDSFLLVLSPRFKPTFEGSVSQLACLLRIFIETKSIQNNNLTQIMQFVAKFVITKRSETISFRSLRSKFYNV